MAKDIGDRLAKSQRQNVLDRRGQIDLQVSHRLQLGPGRGERIAGNDDFVGQRSLMPPGHAFPDRSQCLASYAFHLVGFLRGALLVRRSQSLDELASHDDGGEGLAGDVVDVASDPFPFGDGGEMGDAAVLSLESDRAMVP
jgi:hypothetical protein